jgi:hypothetical protein
VGIQAQEDAHKVAVTLDLAKVLKVVRKRWVLMKVLRLLARMVGNNTRIKPGKQERYLYKFEAEEFIFSSCASKKHLLLCALALFILGTALFSSSAKAAVGGEVNARHVAAINTGEETDRLYCIDVIA